MSWTIVEPVVDLSVRFLCLKKYPGHPQGCPNYEKKEGCPPCAPAIVDLIDLDLPVWAIWNEFDFKGHCRKMRKLYPHWSKRRIECCLYWQPKARKQLKKTIERFHAWYLFRAANEKKSVFEPYVITNPEGAGVNVTETMKSIGIELQWPPMTKTYQIVLAGTAVKESEVVR
ncbi:MAG: hypothetical protein GWN94_10560 [Phycisphaerae bacterium]|nr:hypothetical protein [Phycisphaerae bacterium]NIS51532.1 hypothetical protein [Phycisphaerae bacterium]